MEAIPEVEQLRGSDERSKVNNVRRIVIVWFYFDHLIFTASSPSFQLMLLRPRPPLWQPLCGWTRTRIRLQVGTCLICVQSSGPRGLCLDLPCSRCVCVSPRLSSVSLWINQLPPKHLLNIWFIKWWHHCDIILVWWVKNRNDQIFVCTLQNLLYFPT